MDIKGKQNKGGAYITPCPFNLSLFGVPNFQNTKVGERKCTKCAYFNMMKKYDKGVIDRKSTRLNSSHSAKSRMPSSA